MELRQLRYFVTLADELHFGRAAAREHIVQSALSQQIQRLERELGVDLLERSTHHVALTRAGRELQGEARQILEHVDRATAAVRNAAHTPTLLRAAVGDPSFDSVSQILRSVHYNHPQLVIHRIEAGVPEQYRMLLDGRLDIGVGRASHAPAEVASELFRLDPIGILVPNRHPLARLDAVPLRRLRHQQVLLGEPERMPEFNEFVIEACRAAGFGPLLYPGSVQSVRAAADLVGEGRCVSFVPESCDLLLPSVSWRPIVDPVLHYPWSLLWRDGHETPSVRTVRGSARALGAKLGWLAAQARTGEGRTGLDAGPTAEAG